MKQCKFAFCIELSLLDDDYCLGHRAQREASEVLHPLNVTYADGEEPCSFGDCWRVVYAKTLCQSHYKQSLRGEELRPLRVRIPDAPKTCTIRGCDNPHKGGGLCSAHRYRLKEHGVLGGPITARAPVGEWGAWTLNSKGYVIRQRTDAVTKKRYRQLQHRVVMSDSLGRELLDTEDVHHRNAQRDDNRRENLELWSRSHPAGGRVVDLLDWAREILELYGPIEDELRK